ncbi:MAG: cobalt-precorrin-5B (C(1))-methyltransferase [Christensenellales bacterium]
MKALREGFTTGSCAAAAALASCLWQRDGACPERVEIVVPAGKTFAPEIIAHGGYVWRGHQGRRRRPGYHHRE